MDKTTEGGGAPLTFSFIGQLFNHVPSGIWKEGNEEIL